MSLPPPADHFKYWKRYIYVDAHYQKQNGKASAWKRIKIDELESFRKEAKNYNVFCTVQRYCSATRQDREVHYAPLYFDFDSSKDGPYDFKQVQKDVDKLLEYFFHVLDFKKHEVRVWFSGKKGMHVFVHPVVFNVQPHEELTYIFKNMAYYLKDFLDLKTMDTVVYSIRRQIRLVDSIHQSSGLFKVELTPAEVLKPKEELHKIASEPRGDFYDEAEYEGMIPNDDGEKFYQKYLSIYSKQKNIEKLTPHKLISKDATYPVCVKDLLDNHIRKPQTRNLATMCLASYFKDQGIDEKSAQGIIGEWAKSTPKEYTSTQDERKIKSSTYSCVKSIYDSKDKYHFVCSVMRSIDMECNHADCHITNTTDQEPEKEVHLHLAEASNASYIGTKLKINVLIGGKDTSPYMAPNEIQYLCTMEDFNTATHDNPNCSGCSLGSTGPKFTQRLSSKDPILLELIQCTSVQQYALLKRYARIKAKCAHCQMSVLNYVNIEELEITPEVERQAASLERQEEYVTRRAYYIGSEGVALNQEVQFIGYIYPDPRTQHVVHLSDEVKSSESSLSKFKISPELKQRLKIFQPCNGQTIANKLNEVYLDFERNILRIWQRREMLLAMDLVYHSALQFIFQGQLLQKGWLEAFILGDCIVGDSLLFTSDGIKRIDEYDDNYPKDKFITMQHQSLLASWPNNIRPTHFFARSKQKTIKITTRYGYNIEGTHNQPLLVLRNGEMKFVKVHQLNKEDYVAIQYNQNLFGKHHNPLLGRIMGYLTGDGACKTSQITFHNTKKETLKDFQSIIYKLFNFKTKVYNNRSIRLNTKISNYLEQLGLKKVLSGDKQIPDFILKADKETVKEFLKGLYETDGHYCHSVYEVDITLKTQRLIDELQILLLNFGIISVKKARYNKKYKRYYWKLKIMGKFYKKFLNEIGFLTKEKQKSNAYKPSGSTNTDIIPNISSLINNVWQEYKKYHKEIRCRKPDVNWLSINTIRQARYGNRNFSYPVLKKFLEGTKQYSYLKDYQYLKLLAESQFYWEPISKIEKKKNFTYDFHVPKLHCFFANGFICHNTGQAKSDMAMKLQSHYALGARISGEGARRTGLAWTWHQNKNRWFIRFGMIPNNDKRLVFIDEASGIENEELSKLTDMRSTGVADATGGPIPAKANARTRLIWLSNARHGQKLGTFGYGVLALPGIFKHAEDVRRIDFALAVGMGEVSPEIINNNIAQVAAVEHLYTSDLCHNLILWAWTRKPNQIVFSPEATQLVLDKSLAMGKIYSPKIPLVEVAVQRHKIARLAVAIAIRMFSTDDGEIVKVLPEHVEFSTNYLDQIYGRRNFDYLNWSKNNKSEFTQENYIEAEQSFEVLFSSPRERQALASMLLRVNTFNVSVLTAAMSCNREKANEIMRALFVCHMIEFRNRGAKLTEAGVLWVKQYLGILKGVSQDTCGELFEGNMVEEEVRET